MMFKCIVFCILVINSMLLFANNIECKCYKELNLQTFLPYEPTSCKQLGNTLGYKDSSYTDIFKVYYNNNTIVKIEYSIFTMEKINNNRYKVLVFGNHLKTRNEIFISPLGLKAVLFFDDLNEEININVNKNFDAWNYISKVDGKVRHLRKSKMIGYSNFDSINHHIVDHIKEYSLTNSLFEEYKLDSDTSLRASNKTSLLINTFSAKMIYKVPYNYRYYYFLSRLLFWEYFGIVCEVDIELDLNVKKNPWEVHPLENIIFKSCITNVNKQNVNDAFIQLLGLLVCEDIK